VKSGVKRLIFTALCICSSAFGSWDTNSWSSTNSYRIPVTTNYLAATNYWAKEHVDVWTQTSTTNYIPELTNDISGYLGPIGGYTNSGSRTWTNIYWTDIQADVPTNTTAGWYGTNQVTNVYTFIVTVDTNTVTNTLTTSVLSITAPTNIEWNLDVQWIWGFDSYLALNERLDILGDAITYTPKLYKDQRTNLVEWKTVVESIIPDFVDTTLFTNGGVITNEFLTITGLLENISAPTNYFDYTPYRDLGGWQPGLSNVVDGIWEFPVWTTNTTTITNSIMDACGSNYTYTLLGSTNTNGVVISVDFELFSGTNSLATYTATNSTEVYTNAFTCTNDFIASGFTERDYGFKWVPDIMDQLVMI